MSVVVRFADRLRSLGSFLEDELLGLVAGYNTLIGVQHSLDTGEHTDITCDSIASNKTALDASRIVRYKHGAEWQLGPWLLDGFGNNTHQSGIRPPQWVGNQVDYAPAGIDSAVMVEVTSDADGRTISGIKQYQRQKRYLMFANRGNFYIILKHNTASTGIYRFGLPANQDFFLGPSHYVWLYYDVGSEIWRIVGLPEPVSVQAYLSANQLITSGVYNKVALNAEQWDPYNIFDSVTNNRFTAPVAGKYWVSIRGALDGPSATQCSAALYKNGALDMENLTGLGLDNAVTVHLTTMIDCVAGDYLEFFVLQNRGISINLLGGKRYTSMSVSLFGG